MLRCVRCTRAQTDMSCNLISVFNVVLFLTIWSEVVLCQYVIPNVDIQVFKPKGIKVSIPDANDIRLFAFHGSLTAQLNVSDTGTLNGEVLEVTKGRWVYQNDDIQLEVGDVLYYWVFVQNGEHGFIKDKQRYEVKELLEPGAVNTIPPPRKPPTPRPSDLSGPASCLRSVTEIYGRRSPCVGQLIFDETFDNISMWQTEQKLPPDDKEYPFVSYQDKDANVAVSGGRLRITPTLLQTTAPYEADSVTSGILNLYRGCTVYAENCYQAAAGSNILPPIISGRINTSPSFAFKYGTVEIRAKLPRGDWIYPELLLEPATNKYGSEGYASGSIRIAFSRGNLELRYAGREGDHDTVDGRVLYAGVVLDQFQCHDNFMYSTRSDNYWSDDFHTYSVKWEPDVITFSVDGTRVGSVHAAPGGFRALVSAPCPHLAARSQRWTPGTDMAPFDQPFYITLGVGVGGVTDFPDRTLSTLGLRKPWENKSSKARIQFWRDLSNWFSTWDQASSLLVDSVKVYAL